MLLLQIQYSISCQDQDLPTTHLPSTEVQQCLLHIDINRLHMLCKCNMLYLLKQKLKAKSMYNFPRHRIHVHSSWTLTIREANLFSHFWNSLQLNMVDNHVETQITLKIVKNASWIIAHLTFVCTGCGKEFQMPFISAEILKETGFVLLASSVICPSMTLTPYHHLQTHISTAMMTS